jgi:1-acyl-sn-glycerol-3-phosphate acyltransferase
MIKARHNPLVYSFFKTYTRVRIRKNFQQVVFSGDTAPTNNAVLLLSNHCTWWDGFWALYLNIHVFKKQFHFMMDETELSKRWLFSLSGGYSIRPTSKSLFESLRYTEELLSCPDNLVVIYPQGKLHSSHTSTVEFKKGIDRLRFGMESQPDIYFLVQLTDYFQFEKPSLYFYLEKASNNRNFEADYNSFYQRCIHQHSLLTV